MTNSRLSHAFLGPVLSIAVNYPHKWMGRKKPEIHVESDDELDDATTLHLPPLKTGPRSKRKT